MCNEEWVEFVEETGAQARARIERMVVEMHWFEDEQDARTWLDRRKQTGEPAEMVFRSREQMLQDSIRVRDLPQDGDVFVLLVPPAPEEPESMTEIIGLVFRDIITARFASEQKLYVAVVGRSQENGADLNAGPRLAVPRFNLEKWS